MHARAREHPVLINGVGIAASPLSRVVSGQEPTADAPCAEHVPFLFPAGSFSLHWLQAVGDRLLCSSRCRRLFLSSISTPPRSGDSRSHPRRPLLLLLLLLQRRHCSARRFNTRSSANGSGSAGNVVVPVKAFTKLAEAVRLIGVPVNSLSNLVRETDGGRQQSHKSGFALRDCETGRLHVFQKKTDAMISYPMLRDAAARLGGKAAQVRLELESVEPVAAPPRGPAVLAAFRAALQAACDAAEQPSCSSSPSSSSLSSSPSPPPTPAVAPAAVAQQQQPRLPVVAVLGHINHGKTTLLDRIAGTDFTSFEVAGITQHIRAVQVEFPDHADDDGDDGGNDDDQKPAAVPALSPPAITFVDTPGHVAFSHSRFVGAEAADLALVLCAVNEGPQPQTLDALRAAVRCSTPVLLVLTKSDLLPRGDSGSGGGGDHGGDAYYSDGHNHHDCDSFDLDEGEGEDDDDGVDG